MIKLILGILDSALVNSLLASSSKINADLIPSFKNFDLSEEVFPSDSSLSKTIKFPVFALDDKADFNPNDLTFFVNKNEKFLLTGPCATPPL